MFNIRVLISIRIGQFILDFFNFHYVNDNPITVSFRLLGIQFSEGTHFKNVFSFEINGWDAKNRITYVQFLCFKLLKRKL